MNITIALVAVLDHDTGEDVVAAACGSEIDVLPLRRALREEQVTELED